MIALKEILVATDFGPASDNALRYGQALAREFDGRLHVFHATPNVFATSMDGYGYASIPDVNPEKHIQSRAPADGRAGDR